MSFATKFMLPASILLASLAVSPQINAQNKSLEKKAKFSVGVGAFGYSDNNLREAYGPTFMIEGGIESKISSQVSLGGRVSLGSKSRTLDKKETIGDRRYILKGETSLSFVNLNGMIFYKIPSNKTNFNLGAGFVYCLLNQKGSGTSEVQEKVGYYYKTVDSYSLDDQDSESGFGASILFGLDLPLSKNNDLFFELTGKYLRTESGGNVGGISLVSGLKFPF